MPHNLKKWLISSPVIPSKGSGGSVVIDAVLVNLKVGSLGI